MALSKINISKGAPKNALIVDALGLYSVVYDLLCEMAEKADIKSLQAYYVASTKLNLCKDNRVDLYAIFLRLIGSLQNRNMMPSVIQYWDKDRYSIINELLSQKACPERIDKAIIQSSDPASTLYELIKKALTKSKGKAIVEKGDTPSKLWLIWCKGIISAAQFLGQFRDAQELHNCFARLYDDPRTRSVLPAMLAMEIEGMQFTLACDFLKECGYDYPKPDVHITDVFEEICGTRDTYQIYKKVIEFAEELRKEDKSMTAYKLDKMIWLICSGSFYLEGKELEDGGHEGKDVGSFKDELIHRLGMTAIKDRPWYKDAEKKKKERNKK